VSVDRVTGLFLGLLPLALAAAGPPRLATLDGKPLDKESVDVAVESLMTANRVPGMALALVRDGKVAYVHAYGLRDVVKGLPLTPDTPPAFRTSGSSRPTATTSTAA
jgi:CubicO group peptidase (beta-lactamase class C family)